jgi:hypothetical protein
MCECASQVRHLTPKVANWVRPGHPREKVCMALAIGNLPAIDAALKSVRGRHRAYRVRDPSENCTDTTWIRR